MEDDAVGCGRSTVRVGSGSDWDPEEDDNNHWSSVWTNFCLLVMDSNTVPG